MARMTRSSFLSMAAGAVTLSGSAAAQSQRVFEIRTYYTLPGRLPNLLARFRDHTVRLFEKHGITNIGYWIPTDAPGSENTLIYIVAFPSREAAKKSWDDFRADPDWQKARAESEKDGKIVDRIESVYMNPATFSALR
jgi:hypothetical protein